MPGIYLGAILFSLLGIALVDVRFRLALRPHPGR
ncbi:MAG TPA: lycopene cyclase domain-containing protein, partial [Microbacterium sp.]|nr:lycopene cyclase domain-containing protein [Microbacterium sp.]